MTTEPPRFGRHDGVFLVMVLLTLFSGEITH